MSTPVAKDSSSFLGLKDDNAILAPTESYLI